MLYNLQQLAALDKCRQEITCLQHRMQADITNIISIKKLS
jgi:hypothetical protein